MTIIIKMIVIPLLVLILCVFNVAHEKIFFPHINFWVSRISFSFVCVNIPAGSSFVLKFQFCIHTKGDGVRS